MSIGIGEALRETRERVGIRLADAAAETRIRQAHLVALEEETFATIGGDVYVKGFIRSYARHLGLDPEPLVRAYQEHYEASDADEGWVATREPVESLPPPRRPITTIVVVLAVLMVGGLALLGFLVPDDAEDAPEISAPDPVGGDEDPDAGPDDDPEGNGDEEPGSNDLASDDDPGEGDDAGQDEDGADNEAEDEGDDSPDMTEEIVLTLTVPDGRSWASITVDGQEVEASNLESGFSETYTGEEITIRVGDAAHVSLEVNGEDLGTIGGSGAVVDVVCSTSAGSCEIG